MGRRDMMREHAIASSNTHAMQLCKTLQRLKIFRNVNLKHFNRRLLSFKRKKVMDYIFKQRIITIRNISPYLTMQEIQKENLKDYVIHKLIKDGSTFHIYISYEDGDSAVKKLEKDLKALPMRLNCVNMKLHSNILCVTGIMSSLTEEILQQVLQGFGEVLVPFKLIKSKRTNESKGYGWLVFKDIKSAEKCLWMIPKLDLQTRPLRAGWAGNTVTCEDDLSSVSTIYVEGLPASINTVKDLRQFLSKNDEISFCQFSANEHTLSQSNFAIVEFKNSEAAEQCVIENNGAEVIDGILHLTYAIPGYSGVDFVWNKPVNNHYKRSQPNNRSLPHFSQCCGPVSPVGYVRSTVNMQITPRYQNTVGQISSHYVPMSEIRPQLVGVRPFVYTPTGLQNMQHHSSHQVNQHFQQNYPQHYQQPLKNQQTQQQIQQVQYQPPTNYQPQIPIQPNQMLLQQPLTQEQQSVVDVQQQAHADNQQQHPNSASQQPPAQHPLVKLLNQQTADQESLQQAQQNENLSQLSQESAQEQQQHVKQQLVATKESYLVAPMGHQLSQQHLEELTVRYRHQQQKQQQQQQQQQPHHQQQRQQQPSQKFSEINQVIVMEHSKQTQPIETELKNFHQPKKTQQNPKQQHNSEAFNQTEKSSHQLNLRCSQNNENVLQYSGQAAVSVAKDQLRILTMVNEKQQSSGGDRHNNGNNETIGCRPPKLNINENDQNQSNEVIAREKKERKQIKEEMKPAIRILNNRKIENPKQEVCLKPDGANEAAGQRRATEIEKSAQQSQSQLQKEIVQLQQQHSPQEKEHHKDLRKNNNIPEKKTQLASKEKLFLLQQQMKRQAEALERLAQCKTKNKLKLKQESKNNDYKNTPNTTSSVAIKNSLLEINTREKTPTETGSDFIVGSKVQVLKKREGNNSLLRNKNIEDNVKLTEKEEKTSNAARPSPSKIRFAQRMDIDDDSEIKEKRPRLEKDESQSQNFTATVTSTNTQHNTVLNVADMNSTALKCVGNHNNETNLKLRSPEEVESTSQAEKTTPERAKISESSEKTAEFPPSSDEESSSLCLLMNQLNLKDDVAQAAKATTAKNQVSHKIDNRCKENDRPKEISGKIIPLSKENDTGKAQEQTHSQCQDINCKLPDKENTNAIINQEKMKNERFVITPSTVVCEKKKFQKLLEQEKQNFQKSFPVAAVDSKAANVVSNMKTSERNFKIELAPTFNQTGIIRPIPKLPLQSICTGIHPEFSPMPIPSQFSHPPPQVNNIQQFQTFTNNQFQPIVRAEPRINPVPKPLNFIPSALFNHQILPPMPSGHILAQNDTFTTNTHYDPVMVPNSLLMGVPGIPAHASHHIARPIPHLPPGPPQPWPGHHQTMPLPPMMHQLPIQNRMTHFSPAYPPVLPNIGVNRNTSDFYPKIPERLPKIQPDTAFHLSYNNLANIPIKFAGRNQNEEAAFHVPSFQVEANPTAQFKNCFSVDRPPFNTASQDMHGYTAVNSSNSRSEEIPAMQSTPAQVETSKASNPLKVADGVSVYEQTVNDQGNSNKNGSKMNIAEALAAKMDKGYPGAKQQILKADVYGNFKQSTKVPTFNRTVRELISVPFTSDESRLVYLLRKRHQCHPIAQEWLLIGNGLLTSHFRKLWDPPYKDEGIQNDFEEMKADCVCRREPDTLKCYGCSKQFFGRIRYHCELHPYREYLTDFRFCPYCGIDLVWTEEPW